MEKSVFVVGDEASKALVAAGQASVKPHDRVLIPVPREEHPGEDVAIVLDAASGMPQISASLTTALRRANFAPEVMRESLELARVSDLLAYIKRFQRAGTSVFTAAPLPGGRAGFAKVIIDYSGRDALAWHRHSASVPLRLSPDAVKWLNVTHSQAEIATLFDDFAPFVRGKVSAGELIAAADDLEVTEMTVTSAKRNKSTRMLDVELRGQTSVTVAIPPSFTLEIPLLENRPAIEVEVKLELRKRGEAFGFFTTIRGFERLLATEFDKVNAELQELSGCPLFQVTHAAPSEMSVG